MSEETKPTATVLDLGACVAHRVKPDWKQRAEEAEADAEQAYELVDVWRERALKAEQALASMAAGVRE